MIYRIYYQGVVKFATPVKNREELMALRNSKENLEHLAKARAGDQKEKGKLLQLAYNLGYAEGKLAGCESQGSFLYCFISIPLLSSLLPLMTIQNPLQR